MIRISCEQYLEYLEIAAEAIRQQKDYITELDAAIADGDHWLNVTIGLDKVLAQREELSASRDFTEFFKKLAMAVMPAMGGTSGALYGSAYLSAAKALAGSIQMDAEQVAVMLKSWAEAIMARGNAKPGDKTMVDAIWPAAEGYEAALKEGKTEQEALTAMKELALAGAERTRGMEAAKGRASNQPDKGVGHLDPGAVTMAIQLECLANYLEKYGGRD